jgi:hypothetical protein
MRVAEGGGKLIDGRSNICAMGDLSKLLNVEDITAINISVAFEGTSSSLDGKITKPGLLPLTLYDGTIYYQTCFYFANMIDTILSPMAILASSDVFYFWNQEGCKDPTISGWIRFTSKDGLLSIFFNLEYRDGLYYCLMDIFTVIMIQFVLVVIRFKHRHCQISIAYLPNLSRLQKPGRWNPRSGCFALVPLVNINWMFSKLM